MALGLDPGKLEDYLKNIAQVDSDGCRNKFSGRRIKVVIHMHVFGHPVDLDPLVEVCRLKTQPNPSALITRACTPAIGGSFPS